MNFDRTSNKTDPRTWATFRAALRVLAATFLLYIIFAPFFGHRSEPQPAPTPRPTLPGKQPTPSGYRVLSIKEHYPQARAIADEWDEESYVILMGTTFLPTDVEHPLSSVYYFIIEARGYKSDLEYDYLAVRFEETEAGIGTEVEEGYEKWSRIGWYRECVLAIDEVKSDSAQAVALISKAGGNAFIEQYGYVGTTSMLMLSCGMNEETLEWVATYKNEVYDVEWEIKMDAKTNEVFPVEIISDY